MNDNLKHIIDTIKDRVDINQVISEYVELDRNNKALCPFHNEKTPSFSVNTKGQYFHCFGCGVGGDVFRFLMLIENRSFYDVLKDLAPRAGVDISNISGVDINQLEEKNKIENVLSLTAKFYNNNLTKEATDYLIKNRGFTEDSILRFQIGFSNGGLREYLLNKCGLKPEFCLKAGVLIRLKDGKIRDYFYNRIVFPNLKYGRVVHLSGRSIGEKNPKYLHLPGPIKHLFNEEALNDNDVIIAEGIPDCISANQAGLAAVGILGTSHFRKEFAPKFSRCDSVYVCMDGDKAGQKAARKIGEILPDKAIIVSLPDGCDLNEYLIAHTNDEFQKLLDDSRPYLEIEIEAIKKLPENQRLSQLNKLLPKLKAFKEFRRSHYRTIISKEFGIDKKTIDKGINSTIDSEFDKIKIEISTPEPPFTEDERKEAIELLKDENLLDRFNKAAEKMGCVGEVNNKLLVFFTLTSRILDDPISLIVKGNSSGGKSFLVETVQRFFPHDKIKMFTTISSKALYYRNDDLSHKALIIFERPGAEDSDYSIRTLQSEKKLVISVTIKNPKTQQWETIDREIPGPIAYIETTTKSHLHDENETRCFEIFIDDSEEQTKKILENQRKEYDPNKTNAKVDLRTWQVAQMLLKPYPVIIPYIEHIKFPSKPLRVRRDFKRFLVLIEVSAILNQYRREKIIRDGQECLIADVEDYAIAYNLGSVILQQTIKQISPNAEKLIYKVEKFIEESGKETFTRRDMQDLLEYDRKTITKYINECRDQGLIEVVDGGKGKAYVYRFVRLPDSHDNLLVHPNELRQVIKENDLSKLSIPVQNDDGQVNSLEIDKLTQPIHQIPADKVKHNAFK